MNPTEQTPSESAPEQTSASKPCSYCGGSGFALGYEDCHCKGTGEESGQPASESSHSPTEQHALSEEDRKRINAYAKGIANGAGDGNANFDDYAYEIAMRASEYEHRHMVDKQAELIADNTVLKNKLSEFEKNWREINHKYIDLQSENANQSAELEQLRSERDKMREALKISKSWVSQITNVYLEEGRDKIVSIIESALSEGSKQ